MHWNVRRSIKRAGKSLGNVAKTIAKGVATVTRGLVEAPLVSTEATAKGINHAARELGQELRRAGRAIDDAAEDVGDALEDVRDYVTEHPFETALILGGGFTCFVVFADLGVVTVSIITPAGSAVVYTLTRKSDESRADQEKDENEPGPADDDTDPNPGNGTAPPKGQTEIIAHVVRRDDAFPVQPLGTVQTPIDEGINFEFSFPTAAAILRKPEGDFVDIRTDDRLSSGLVRRHGGLDFLCSPGDTVFASMSGAIIRPSNPYRGVEELGGVLIENEFGFSSRIFYVQMNDQIATALLSGKPVPVRAGQPIGTCQDVEGYYRDRKHKEVPNHVHVEWRSPEGHAMLPDGSLMLDDKPK